MTHPAVDELPEAATSALLGLYEQLSRSRHPRLARWAAAVSDALLVQLASVTSGARIDVVDFEACGPLAQLDDVELEALRAVVLGATTSDDVSVVEWCTRMDRLIDADLWRREYEQAVIDAKAAVIEAEERRLACQARTTPHLRSVSPWSGA
jgi:hypothetical protein